MGFGVGFQVSALGFLVLGSGFRILGGGFRILGFGFWMSGLRVWVSGSGFREVGFGFRVSGFGFRMSGLRFWVSGSGFWEVGFGFRVSGLLEARVAAVFDQADLDQVVDRLLPWKVDIHKLRCQFLWGVDLSKKSWLVVHSSLGLNKKVDKRPPGNWKFKLPWRKAGLP